MGIKIIALMLVQETVFLGAGIVAFLHQEYVWSVFCLVAAGVLNFVTEVRIRKEKKGSVLDTQRRGSETE